MPTYEFYNTKTDEMEEHRMSYKDLDKFAEEIHILKKEFHHLTLYQMLVQELILVSLVDLMRCCLKLQINILGQNLQRHIVEEVQKKLRQMKSLKNM